ncbi:hypothetical protein ABZ345_29415 [Lentzea sp. NPDC005914]|uniref:hypothetical protein n=1 Tax=Lentzea sp. NPDC005914 TaxID=3154572 RepID=UPI0034072082
MRRLAPQSSSRIPRRGIGGHTDEEKLIYPRYHVADAMLSEVERLDPDDLPPPERLAAVLATAATTAQPIFTATTGTIEAEATAAERELFRKAIAYASHESSVAFAGTLADRLRSSWPDLDDWAQVPRWDQSDAK